MPRRERIFWLIAGLVLFVGVMSLIPSHYPICEVAEKTKEEDCPAYRVLPFLIVKIGKALDDHNGAVTALFTVILAVSTIGLWVATRRLWVAGERQFRHARANALAQSREMRASIEVSKTAADAAKRSADASLVALRPWVSCNVEIAGALTYTAAGDAQFELRFVVKNVGHSPAFGVRLIPFLNLLSPAHEQSILKLQRIAGHNRSMPVDASVVLLPGGIPIGDVELGLILFPGETSTFDYKMPIRRGEIERSFEDIKPNTHFMPQVFGLVAYTYPLADVRADTGFGCSIENMAPDSKTGFAFDLDQSVRPEYMRVANHWGGFAT